MSKNMFHFFVCLFFNTSKTSFSLLHPPRSHPSESLLLFSLQKRAYLPGINQTFITICNKTRNNRSYQGWEIQPSGIKRVPGAGKMSEIPPFPPQEFHKNTTLATIVYKQRTKPRPMQVWIATSLSVSPYEPCTADSVGHVKNML